MELLVEHGRCVGIKTKNRSGQIAFHYANTVVLAAGGCAGIYAFSSNSQAATGMELRWRTARARK